MWWDWNVPKYINHSSFNCKQKWGGHMPPLKEKRESSLWHLKSDSQTWNDNLPDLQLRTGWDDSWFDPTINIVCRVRTEIRGSASTEQRKRLTDKETHNCNVVAIQQYLFQLCDTPPFRCNLTTITKHGSSWGNGWQLTPTIEQNTHNPILHDEDPPFLSNMKWYFRMPSTYPFP